MALFMDVQNLIPKDKYDIETAAKLKAYSYNQIKPIVYSLLQWLQDINWPVAKPIAEYLITIHENITNEIVYILKGTDDIWKYWILSVFGQVVNNAEILREIKRIAYEPTSGEISEEVDVISLEILQAKGLIDNA